MRQRMRCRATTCGKQYEAVQVLLWSACCTCIPTSHRQQQQQHQPAHNASILLSIESSCARLFFHSWQQWRMPDFQHSGAPRLTATQPTTNRLGAPSTRTNRICSNSFLDHFPGNFALSLTAARRFAFVCRFIIFFDLPLRSSKAATASSWMGALFQRLSPFSSCLRFDSGWHFCLICAFVCEWAQWTVYGCLNRSAVALFQSESFFNFRCVFVIWTVKRQRSTSTSTSVLLTAVRQHIDKTSVRFAFHLCVFVRLYSMRRWSLSLAWAHSSGPATAIFFEPNEWAHRILWPLFLLQIDGNERRTGIAPMQTFRDRVSAQIKEWTKSDYCASLTLHMMGNFDCGARCREFRTFYFLHCNWKSTKRWKHLHMHLSRGAWWFERGPWPTLLASFGRHICSVMEHTTASIISMCIFTDKMRFG